MSSFSELPADTLVIISSYWGYGSGALLRVSKDTREKLLNREFPFPIFVYRTRDEPWFPKEESLTSSNIESHLYKTRIKYSQLAMSLRANWRMLRNGPKFYASVTVKHPLRISALREQHTVLFEVIEGQKMRIKYSLPMTIYPLFRLYFAILNNYLPTSSISRSPEILSDRQVQLRTLSNEQVHRLLFQQSEHPYGKDLWNEYQRRLGLRK